MLSQYAEPVPSDEVEDDDCWRLEHFPVTTSGKLLVVWNSASKCHGTSLNQGLEKGPAYLKALLEVLTYLRMGEVEFLGDIRKMFNQIEIAPRDGDFHRFLW